MIVSVENIHHCFSYTLMTEVAAPIINIQEMGGWDPPHLAGYHINTRLDTKKEQEKEENSVEFEIIFIAFNASQLASGEYEVYFTST